MRRSPRGARAGWVAWRGWGGRLLAGLLVAGALGGVARAAPGLVELVSRGDPPSDTATGFLESMSADGRYVVFSSSATNVVAGQVDAGLTFDLFLHDRVTGATTLVSRAAASPVTAGNGDSLTAAVSADGAFVAFRSTATNLVPGQVDGNGGNDVFLYDRVAGTTTLVSRAAASPVTAGNGVSFNPALSADGAFVAFLSVATNLVAGQVDTNGGDDVFLYDRVAQTTTLVSRTAASAVIAGSGVSLFRPRISADGGFVAFGSLATDLVTGQTDTNARSDVFLYERATGGMTLVSRKDGLATTTGDGASDPGVISADGTFVAFNSAATNLVPLQADVNGTSDVFLYEVATGQVTLVSRVQPLVATTGNGSSNASAISADGQFVAFGSQAKNLVVGQVDGSFTTHLFLYDRVAQTTTLVSRVAGTAATTAGFFSDAGAISADGRFVAFQSGASNLVAGQVDGNGGNDVFLYDRLAGASTLVSRTVASPVTTGNGRSEGLAMSADGQFVAFTSVATDLVVGVADLNAYQDAFVFDGGSASMTVVSRRDPAVAGASAAGESFLRRDAASADGRFVVFESGSENLVAGQVDANATTDVFLYDRVARTTTLVSRADGSAVTTGNALSDSAVISADGRFVAFESEATDLVASQVDSPGTRDVFLHDRVAGTTTLVSRAAGSAATVGNGHSAGPVISADGGFVAFESEATDLVANPVDANGTGDVFLYDRVAETTILVSRKAGLATTAGSASSGSPAVSADGGFVAFASSAIDLVAGQADANGTADVFLFDRGAETTTLVSRTVAPAVTTGNRFSNFPALSADGRFVAFRSGATDLVAGLVDGNGTGADLFLYDRVAETTTLVSRTPGSAVSSGNAGVGDDQVVSADGGFVAFVSRATDLVAGQVDANGGDDVFLYDRVAGTTTLVSRTAGSAVTTGDGDSNSPALSADGRLVAFQSQVTNLVAGQADGNGDLDVFLYDREAGATTLVSRANRVGARRTATTGNGFSESPPPSLSADGTVVAFSSGASDLTADDDVNGLVDVFVLARPCAAPSGPRPCPGAASRPPR